MKVKKHDHMWSYDKTTDEYPCEFPNCIVRGKWKDNGIVVIRKGVKKNDGR